jgi:hypothetical protein
VPNVWAADFVNGLLSLGWAILILRTIWKDPANDRTNHRRIRAGPGRRGGPGRPGQSANGRDGAEGTSDASVTSNAGPLFLDSPVSIHVTVIGNAGEANGVTKSHDGQAALVSSELPSVLAERPPRFCIPSRRTHQDCAGMDSPQPCSHTMREPEFEGRLMAKVAGHGDWNWVV